VVIFLRNASDQSVFISYARSDGADFAARVRRRLEEENPEIRQDVISERGRRDWWLQITEASPTSSTWSFMKRRT
jgi:hypothetical protein